MMPSRLLRFFLPQQLQIDAREMWRSAGGATLAIAMASSLSYLINGFVITHHWLMASLGATALLIFLLPTSPLAQPYPVIVGNTVGAVIGVSCALVVPHPVVAVTLAIALVIPATYVLRCVHPPSVALALYAALQGISDYHFALFPVLFDSCVLVLIGVVYNRLTGKMYPLQSPGEPHARPVALNRFTSEDIDAALTRYNQALNVSREDLEALLAYLETAAFHRTLNARKCTSIMSQQVLCISPEATVQEAWDLMQAKGVKALPVTDREQCVIGIVTMADFLRKSSLNARGASRMRLGDWLRKPGFLGKSMQQTVGEIMTSPAVTARVDQSVAALIPLFSQGRHRHLPVVDEQGRMVGMVTQSDLLVDLYSLLATGQPQERYETSSHKAPN